MDLLQRLDAHRLAATTRLPRGAVETDRRAARCPRGRSEGSARRRSWASNAPAAALSSSQAACRSSSSGSGCVVVGRQAVIVAKIDRLDRPRAAHSASNAATATIAPAPTMRKPRQVRVVHPRHAGLRPRPSTGRCRSCAALIVESGIGPRPSSVSARLPPSPLRIGCMPRVGVVGPAACRDSTRVDGFSAYRSLPCVDARAPDVERNRVVDRVGVEAVVEPDAAVVGRDDDRRLAAEAARRCRSSPESCPASRRPCLQRRVVLGAAPLLGVAGRVGIGKVQEACS